MDDSSVIETLRTVRKADDVIDRLKAESLESRRDRIAEALKTWEGGPADLIATFPHHALASKDGVLMRVRVDEDDDGIAFGKIEVHHIPTPPSNIGREVMETAMSAVDDIYHNRLEEARPKVTAIANALYTSGDLRQRIMAEVARQSISRQAWWHNIVSEHLTALGESVKTVPVASPDSHEGLASAVDVLHSQLSEMAASAANAIQEIADQDLPEVVSDAVRDIAADFKYALQSLSSAKGGSADELLGIYEGVAAVATQLQAGARFLETLAGKDGSD
jgi:hypothetical protein